MLRLFDFIQYVTILIYFQFKASEIFDDTYHITVKMMLIAMAFSINDILLPSSNNVMGRMIDDFSRSDWLTHTFISHLRGENAIRCQF